MAYLHIVNLIILNHSSTFDELFVNFKKLCTNLRNLLIFYCRLAYHLFEKATDKDEAEWRLISNLKLSNRFNFFCNRLRVGGTKNEWREKVSGSEKGTE